MLRNVLIAALAVLSAVLGYSDYRMTQEAEKQAQALTEANDKAAKLARDLAALNQKFVNEERARQVAEQDAKNASAQLAQTQTERDKFEQAAKAANDEAAKIRMELNSAQQAVRDAQEAANRARADRDSAEQALKRAQEELAKRGEHKPGGH